MRFRCKTLFGWLVGGGGVISTRAHFRNILHAYMKQVKHIIERTAPTDMILKKINDYHYLHFQILWHVNYIRKTSV